MLVHLGDVLNGEIWLSYCVLFLLAVHLRTESQCCPCQVLKQEQCESFPPASLIFHSDESLSQACSCLCGFEGKEKKATQLDAPLPVVHLPSTRWKSCGFFLRSLSSHFSLHYDIQFYVCEYLWTKVTLFYTSTFLFLCIASFTTIMVMAAWKDSGRFVRHSTWFWIVREIFLPYTCLALLESFSISVHVFAS